MKKNYIILMVIGAGFLLMKQVKASTYQGDLGQLLDRGKRIHHSAMIKQPSTVLNLLQGEVQKRYVKDSNELGWVLYDTERMPTISYSDLKKYISSYIERNDSEFHINFMDLSFIGERKTTNSLFIMSYKRMINGLELRDSFIDFVFQIKEGHYRLREVHNRTSGAVSVDTNSKRLSKTIDEIINNNDLSLLEQETIYILDKSSDAKIVLATKAKLKNIQSGEVIHVLVNHRNESLIEAYSNRIYKADHQIQARVWKQGYLDAQLIDIGLGEVQITGFNTDVQSNPIGVFQLEDGDEEVNISLQGDRVRVVDVSANSNQVVGFQTTLSKESTIVSNEVDQFLAINAYTSIMRISEFVKQYLKESDTRYLTQQITVNINVDGACNAFYDGNISLFVAGIDEGGVNCANMAGVNDVIYHEWGHGLDNFTGRNGGGIDDGAFSEGIGDIVAAYYLDTPNMASGFVVGQRQGIRNLDNSKVYPEDLVRQVHADGEIIGAVFWKLRAALKEKYGSERGAHKAAELFFNHLLQTDSYTESYQAVLRLDDDDGNPATQSENFCIINSAFATHGLADREENCSEEDEDIRLLDEDLFLGMLSGSSPGQVNFMASGPETVIRLFGCYGERLECLSRDVLDFELDEIVMENGIKYFYHKQPVSILEHQILTLISKDYYGETLGSRTFQFSKR